jgi:hypothetical protein
VTQTDIAPSWISAVAMAPAVIEARKGMNMGLLWWWWLGRGSDWEKKKRPGIAPRALISWGLNFATESMTSPLNSDAHQGLIARQAVTLNVTVVGNQYLGVAKRSLGYV